MTEFSLQSNGNDALIGLAVRVPDSSLEPLLPEGSWALIVQSDAEPKRGCAVMIESPTGEKILGFFILSNPVTGILVMRTNPLLLEPRLWHCPQDSKIIGVVVAVRAATDAGRTCDFNFLQISSA